MYSYGYTKKDFIGNITNPSLSQWWFSKGVSYNCYLECMSRLTDESYYNGQINKVRVIVNSIQAPLNFTFFYWTLLLFILHKFNFKKPVMKIVLGHLIIRCTGDICEEIGGLFTRYYCMKKDPSGNVYCECTESVVHPAKWVITRYFGTLFWYTGEIIADWYPLIRTRAVVKNKSIYIVYITCALFNFSKIVLIYLHWSLNPISMYDLRTGIFNNKVMDSFYRKYWLVQLIIIHASVLYELSVYIVLKKNFFKVSQYDYGFLKKFKSLSEYRILIASIFTYTFLPVASIAIIVKFYFLKQKQMDLEFQFEKLRQSIANFQYYMIFIDQILLITSNYESILSSFNIFNYNSNNSNESYNHSNNNNSNITTIEGNFKESIRGNALNINWSNNSNNNNFKRSSMEKDNSCIANTSMTVINSEPIRDINRFSITNNNNNNLNINYRTKNTFSYIDNHLSIPSDIHLKK
ncbi:hypothetical protein U3516DRAFT_608376 [Neocallimastix sp. 'constans']|jgi:hypothetical protein